MGFVPTPRIYKLTFEDPSMNGLQVRAKSISVDEFMEMTDLGEDGLLKTVTLQGGMPPASVLSRFADSLVEWNLGPDDDPLPCDLETLRKQEIYLVREMVKAWLEAISGVSRPLQQNSNDGSGSAEELMSQLANSSQSLPS